MKEFIVLVASVFFIVATALSLVMVSSVFDGEPAPDTRTRPHPVRFEARLTNGDGRTVDAVVEVSPDQVPALMMDGTWRVLPVGEVVR